MTFVLTTSYFFPGGLLNFDVMKSESLLIAQREGAANCMTTLTLKKNNKFIETNVCFGISETTGDYKISGDTLYFENVVPGRHESDYFEFAIIKKNSEINNDLGDIIRFKDKADTVGLALWISENRLKN